MTETLEQGYARLLLGEINHLRSKIPHNSYPTALVIDNWLDLISSVHGKLRETGEFPFTKEEIVLVIQSIVAETLTNHGLWKGFEWTEVELLLLSLHRIYARKLLIQLEQGQSVQLLSEEEQEKYYG